MHTDIFVNLQRQPLQIRGSRTISADTLNNRHAVWRDKLLQPRIKTFANLQRYNLGDSIPPLEVCASPRTATTGEQSITLASPGAKRTYPYAGRSDRGIMPPSNRLNLVFQTSSRL
uniref:Uncharacterized protein n=1 Tax=Arundo donax TaxID=35708 RepID=A0A0A9HAT0_ARUDO